MYPTDFLVPMDAKDYHAEPLMCSTMLKAFMSSPKGYKRIIDGVAPRVTTPAMDFGTAVHAAILEPDTFDDLYVISDGPINPKTNKPYGRETKAFEEWASTQTKAVISSTDNAKLTEIKADFANNPGCVQLMSQGVAEQVAFATVINTPCKVRIDWFNPDMGIVDIKTTNNLDRFRWQFKDLGYGLQLAFYSQVVLQLTDCAVPCYVIALETSEPYRTAALEIPMEYINIQRFFVKSALMRLEECKESGVWPSGWEGIRTFDLGQYE